MAARGATESEGAGKSYAPGITVLTAGGRRNAHTLFLLTFFLLNTNIVLLRVCFNKNHADLGEMRMMTPAIWLKFGTHVNPPEICKCYKS